VLKAYAAGEIELKKCGNRNRRYVNSPSGGSFPYTTATLREFLGWTEFKVEAALDVMGQEDEGTIEHEMMSATACPPFNNVH
jgi:hypothetical protein